MRRNVDDGQKGSIMRRKFFCVKRFLLGESRSILRREECSIRKRTSYNEKEVPSGQRVLFRAGSSIIAKDILNMKRKLHHAKKTRFSMGVPLTEGSSTMEKTLRHDNKCYYRKQVVL